MDKIKISEKSRFVINCGIDKEYGECEFNIKDSWAEYGAVATFHLPYPYEKSQLIKKLEEAKIALREDFDDAQRESKSLHNFFTFGAVISAIILAFVVIQMS